MPRKPKAVLHLPLPASLEDAVEAMGDVDRRWAGAQITVEPIQWAGGDHMLVVTATRRRARSTATTSGPAAELLDLIRSGGLDGDDESPSDGVDYDPDDDLGRAADEDE